MSPDPPKRTYRPVSVEEKIEFAMARFSPLRYGQGLGSITAIANDADRDPAVVSRAIAAAFREGLVSIERRVASEPRRHHGLEDALKERFPELSDCRVAVTPLANPDLPLDRGAFGDQIHDEIGRAAAAFLINSAIFQSGDVVAVGGGRAVFHTVNRLKDRPVFRARDIILLSLTGDNYARDHSGLINFSLDADQHVSLLGLAFARRVRSYYVSHSIVCEDQLKLRAARASTWFETPPWDKKRRLHCLVGLGVLRPGHRFYDEIVQPIVPRERWFDAIREPLRALIEMCETYSRIPHEYCPVADIANHLFFVRPPASVAMPPRIQQNIERQIQAINRQLLTVHHDELARMDSIILIAGTLSKAHALHQVLLTPDLPVRYLITDVTTARAVLASRSE